MVGVCSPEGGEVEVEGRTGSVSPQMQPRTAIKSAKKTNHLQYSLPAVLEDRSSGRSYSKGDMLGTGGFAKVYHVKEIKTGEVFADKVINKVIFSQSSNAKTKVEREIKLHRKMKNSHVIKFIRFFEDSKYVHILLELAPQKTLLHMSKYRKTLSETEVRYYLKQMVSGTRYIHSRSVLHRDLKLGNMFLAADMTLKIGDFGLATSFADNRPGNLCGTPNYIAPEVLAKLGHSPASEVWSIGCMVYALLCGAPPFETDSVSSTYQLITACEYQLPDHLSPAATDLLRQLLVADPAARAELEPQPGRPSLSDHVFLGGWCPAWLPLTALYTAPVFPLAPLLGTVSSPQQFCERVCACLATALQTAQFITGVPDYLDLAPVFITKWVDYSNKFGFGYQLTDKSVGVKFNDETSIATSQCADSVTFIDQSNGKFNFPYDENSNLVQPKMAERISILKYFAEYMETHLADGPASLPRPDVGGPGRHPRPPAPHLLRWARRGNCVTMELSSKLVQVNFLAEHHKMVVWQRAEDILVTHITPTSSVVSSFSLSSTPAIKLAEHTRIRLAESLREITHLLHKTPRFGCALT